MERPLEKTCIIVLARAGSERIKNKNHVIVSGVPLYEYTFDFVASMQSDVYVISDDSELLEAAENRGFFTIQEPDKYATATGGDMSLMRWVHDQIESDIYFMFPLTSPIRDTEIINSAMTDFYCSANKLSILSVYQHDNLFFRANGSFYGWRKEQLDREFIYDNKSMLIQDIYYYDIDTIEDVEKVEAVIEL